MLMTFSSFSFLLNEPVCPEILQIRLNKIKFNGSFSTNRLYHAIAVGNIGPGNNTNTHNNLIKQRNNTVNQACLGGSVG